MRLCVSIGSQSKQWTFPHTSLTGWFLQRRYIVLPVRYLFFIYFFIYDLEGICTASRRSRWKETQCLGYNWANLSLGDIGINTWTRLSTLGESRIWDSKLGQESLGSRIWELLCLRGPTAIIKDRSGRGSLTSTNPYLSHSNEYLVTWAQMGTSLGNRSRAPDGGLAGRLIAGCNITFQSLKG
jgi:hypothetical protein